MPCPAPTPAPIDQRSRAMPTAPRRRASFALLLLAATLGGCALPPAGAITPPLQANLADIELIDRSTGERLPVWWHQGRRYVAGTPGNRYAVAIRNRSGGRLLAVLAVDGVNAVSGETAAWDQRGYVFAPGQRYEIAGWRKSAEKIAAFEFTALPDSYAARTARPEHVGVIGVALFRELPKPVPAAPPLSQAPQRAAPAGAADNAGAAAEADAARAPAAKLADRASAEAAVREERSRLGTGHGRTETSVVSFTDFERAREQPDQVISIWYDRRENLIAAGVIPPSPRQPAPQPFPGSLGFVPDPPRDRLQDRLH